MRITCFSTALIFSYLSRGSPSFLIVEAVHLAKRKTLNLQSKIVFCIFCRSWLMELLISSIQKRKLYKLLSQDHFD